MIKLFEDRIENTINNISINYPLLLVTGKESYRLSGCQKKIEDNIDISKSIRFCDFSPNPKIEDLNKAYGELKLDQIKTIIAVGGGSVIDMAKLIYAAIQVDGDLKRFIEEKRDIKQQRSLNFIAIPATAGSGSEATHFAVVYVNGIKYSLAQLFLRPDYVILDHEITHSMSPYQTAVTGIDALSQSIESLWSNNITSESREYAMESIRLILDSLSSSVNSSDKISRKKMQKAAYLSGKAININKTTAPHAFSYYLTSRYDIPHGHSVGLLLPHFIRLNGNEMRLKRKEQYSDICDSFQLKDTDAVSEKVKCLLINCGLESDISTILNRRDFDDFYSSVNQERLRNNPVKVSYDDLFHSFYGVKNE